jgi:hypothetical protein
VGIIRQFLLETSDFKPPTSPKQARDLTMNLWNMVLSKIDIEAVVVKGEIECVLDLLRNFMAVDRDVRLLPAILATPGDPPLECNQSAYSNFLTGGLRATPTVVVDIIVFTHEIEVLEIRLSELHGIVDIIVLVEASCTHRGAPEVENVGTNQGQPFLPEVLTHYESPYT